MNGRGQRHESRLKPKSLNVIFVAMRVSQYCSKTSMAPPTSTIAKNIGTVKVNVSHGVSNR